MDIPCSDGDKVTEGWGGEPHEGLFNHSDGDKVAQGWGGAPHDGLRCSAQGPVGVTGDGSKETTKGQVGATCDGQEIGNLVSNLVSVSEGQNSGFCEGIGMENLNFDSKESAPLSQSNF
jgi:hypothetical protein